MSNFLEGELKLAITVTIAAALLSLPATAKDTKIRHSDGSGTVVRTDEKGTRTRHTGGGGTTYGGKRHNDAVRDSMRSGSKKVN